MISWKSQNLIKVSYESRSATQALLAILSTWASSSIVKYVVITVSQQLLVCNCDNNVPVVTG